ncbi:uncharacterized protein NEPG_02081 [Nematocida parisii ERTm1]|nr:uncharacterized protein NEPG_02081 [Nematocida parisii ERTm1]EIJ93125.1 hypothetical protein NEPG_02081 [Nematocida parisii ERTm1]|eukprot:XP_013059908.1 hypothetical protein NEPG_02081 [Nematocida parisii ERTm1]
MYLFNYNNKLNMFNEGEIKTLTEVAKILLYNDGVYRNIDKVLFTPDEFKSNQRFITHCIINNDTYSKYLGKYAFIRQFHMQEVISCVFSVLSMVCSLNCIIYTLYIKYKYINKSNNAVCNKSYNNNSTGYNTHSRISNNLYSNNSTVCNKSYNSTGYNTHSTISITNNTMYNILYTIRTINNTLINKLYPYNTNNNTIDNKLYTYINILLIYYIINTITWLSSGLFHIRDIYITQCVDYFSAILSIFTSIAISLYRLYLINTHCVLSIIWFIHILYMLNNFNFLYNSIICGVFYCLNVILWYIWYTSIKEYSYSRILVLIISGMCISVLFQVIDFGPIYFLLDSHALWHILGFIFSTFLYVFIIIDLYYIKDILYNI